MLVTCQLSVPGFLILPLLDDSRPQLSLRRRTYFALPLARFFNPRITSTVAEELLLHLACNINLGFFLRPNSYQLEERSSNGCYVFGFPNKILGALLRGHKLKHNYYVILKSHLNHDT